MKSVLIKILGALLAETSLANISRKQLILMSGSPRSGTTFVAENLTKALDGCPLVWEPLQDENLSRIKQNDFCIRPLWKDIQENIAIQIYLNKVLSKGRLNYYLAYIRDWKKLKAYFTGNTFALIKFTRGNGIIQELSDQSPNVVYCFAVVRNPFSVISSQLSHHEFKGHPAHSGFIEYFDQIKIAKSSIPQNQSRDLAISWCCDYLNALSTVKKVYYYEDLISDFKILLNDIQDQGVNVNFNISTSQKSSTYIDPSGSTDFTKKYMRNLTSEQIETISKVLKVFRIDYP